MADYIKQIKDSAGKTWDINADLLDGKHYSDIQQEITDRVNSAVETYVVTQTTGSWAGISSFSISKANLNTACGTSDVDFNVGDVILNTTTSVPDWWVMSKTSDSVTLSPLETQSIDHTHSIPAADTDSVNGVTGVTKTNVAVADTAVSVATGNLTNATNTYTAGYVVTSVVHTGSVNGSVTTSLESVTSATTGAVSHTHTVASHNHTYNYSVASEMASAITDLSTTSVNAHSHSSVGVASVASTGTSFAYADGTGTTATFIKTITTASTNTLTTGGASTNTANGGAHSHTIPSGKVVTAIPTATGNNTAFNTGESSPSTGNASSVITGTVVSTASAGSHTHSASGTTAAVITAASLSAASGQDYVYGGGTTNVLNSWTATVDNSGILSFTTTSTAAYSSLSTKKMSFTSGSANVTVTVSASGAHTHNFNHNHTVNAHTHSVGTHTHSIGAATMNATDAVATTEAAAHNHGLNGHTHMYAATIVETSGSAYTDLNTAMYTPHTHTTTNVASYAAGTSTTVVTGAKTHADVIKSLKASEANTGNNSAITTSSAYLKVGSSHNLTIPAPTITYQKLETESIKPAKDNISVVTSVTYASKTFVTGISTSTGPKN